MREVAQERDFICEASRMLHAPYAPSGKGLAPPKIRPEGLFIALGTLRSLYCAVKDAARAETPVSGYLKHGMGT